MTIGWWAEIHERFRLTVSPSLGVGADLAAIDADFALSVDSGLQMDGHGTSGDSFGLSVSPSLDLDGSSRSRGFLDVSVSPTVGMDANQHFSRALDLSVNPVLAAAGTESFRQVLDVSVSPHVGMDAVGRHGDRFGLSVSPSLGMDSAPVSTGDFRLAVSPSLSASAKTHHDSSFDLAVQPVLGAAVEPRVRGAFTVAPVPRIGMGGTGIEPPSEVTLDTLGSASTSVVNSAVEWTHNATGNFVVIWVHVNMDGSGTISGTATYGGLSMTFAGASVTGNSNFGLFCFYLFNPPAGQQTVRVSWSRSGGGAVTSSYGNSISYRHVGSVLPFQMGALSAGTGTRSMVFTSSEGELVSHACAVFKTTSSEQVIIFYNHTWLFGGWMGIYEMVAGHAPGAEQTIFQIGTSSLTLVGIAGALRLVPG